MTFQLLVLLSLPAPVVAQSWIKEIVASSRLPVAAADARDAGVPDAQVRGVLDAIRRSGLPPEDGYRVLEQEVQIVREGGPKENFGAFVQSRLDAGLRGQELAEAIREEHRRMGVGRPDDKGRGNDGPGRKPGDDDAPGRAQPKPADDPGKPNTAHPAPGQPKDSARKGKGGKP
jgi:hypothetical protein